MRSSISLAGLIAVQIEKANVNGQKREYLYAELVLLVYYTLGIRGQISEKGRKETSRFILKLSFWDKLLAAPRLRLFIENDGYSDMRRFLWICFTWLGRKTSEN